MILTDDKASQGLWQRRFVSLADRMRMRVVLGWCDGTSRVLDVGCGDGKLAAALNQKGCEVIGCDISIEQLRLGMETSKSVHFVRADAAHMPLRSESFGIVFAGEVIEHMQNAFESLLEWDRLERRQGVRPIAIGNASRGPAIIPMSSTRQACNGVVREREARIFLARLRAWKTAGVE